MRLMDFPRLCLPRNRNFGGLTHAPDAETGAIYDAG